MKKLLLILIPLVLSSCVTQRLIKKEPANIPLDLPSGKIAYAGTELVDPAIEWTSGNMRYSVPFDRPWFVMKTFVKELPISTGKKIEFKLIDTNLVDGFKKEVKKASINTYATLPIAIPIFDDTQKSPKNQLTLMDPDCLQFLNEQYQCDYYLVTVGSILSYRMPTFFSKSFDLAPKFTVVLYDKMGNKIFMKDYVTFFTNIQESERKIGTYYRYLNETIISNSQLIQTDLRFIKDLQETTNFNLYLLSLIQ